MNEELAAKARKMFETAVELEKLRREVEEAALPQGGAICTEKLMNLAVAELEAKDNGPDMPSQNDAGIGIRLGLVFADVI